MIDTSITVAPTQEAFFQEIFHHALTTRVPLVFSPGNLSRARDPRSARLLRLGQDQNQVWPELDRAKDHFPERVASGPVSDPDGAWRGDDAQHVVRIKHVINLLVWRTGLAMTGRLWRGEGERGVRGRGGGGNESRPHILDVVPFIRTTYTRTGSGSWLRTKTA